VRRAAPIKRTTRPLVCRSSKPEGVAITDYVIWAMALLLVGAMLIGLWWRGFFNKATEE
jgi:hypothetical protein